MRKIHQQLIAARVSPLVGAAAHESNVWVLSDKGRKVENNLEIIWFQSIYKIK
jgi:hypothetical protein